MNRITAAEFQKLSARPKVKARATHVAGEMNRWEGKFSEHLAMRKLVGEIIDYKFEPISLAVTRGSKEKGVRGVWYTPDFHVIELDHTMTLYEVKGAMNRKLKSGEKRVAFVEPQDLIRIKAAAEAHPEFRFVMVWPTKDWQWMEQEY